MAGKFPVGKPRLPSWALPLLALSVSLTVHALWLVIPQKEPLPGPVPKPFRLYAYLNLDARTWSPTLFSLPSSLGFSAAIRQNTSNVRPPLQSPVKLTRFEPVDLEQVFAEPGLADPLLMRSRLPITVFSDPEGQQMQRPPTIFAWTLQVLEGSDIGVELTRLPPPPSSGSPVVLSGVMTIDAAGQVKGLFLDPQVLPADLRTQVLQALRRVRRTGVHPEGRIRFRFAYAPAEDVE